MSAIEGSAWYAGIAIATDGAAPEAGGAAEGFDKGLRLATGTRGAYISISKRFVLQLEYSGGDRSRTFLEATEGRAVSSPSDPILHAWGDLVRHDSGFPSVVSDRRTVSRQDVDQLAQTAVCALREAAVPEGAIVGLDAQNGPDFLAGLLALRRVRAAALLLDTAAPGGERVRAAAEMGAVGVLHSSRSADGGFLFARSGLEDSAVREVEPGIAVVKLTSGSTGAPEGILTSSNALIADDAALALSMSLTREERILAAVPLSHSYGLSSIAMPALMRGATIVIPGDSSPVASMLAADRLGATFLPTAPAYLAALVRLSAPPPLGAALRRVIAAGAPLTTEVAVRFREIYGQPVHVFYGASECGGISYDREGSAAERGTVGEPVEGVRIEIDTASGREGLINVYSPAVAQGYHPNANPRLGTGVFRSSDLGELVAGELRLVGRRSDLINVRGKKVNPREVESVLRDVPGVEDAVVLGAPRAHGGGEVVRSVVASRMSLDERTLRDACRRNLADHKVPRSFVLVPELPTNSRGKLDRAAVRRLCGLAEPASAAEVAGGA